MKTFADIDVLFNFLWCVTHKPEWAERYYR